MPVIKSSAPVLDASGSPAPNILVRAYRRDTGALIGRTFTSDGIGDPTLANTALNLRMWGYPGSTSFEDYSPNPKTIEAKDNAVKTDAHVFNENVSGLFDGDNDRLVVTGLPTIDTQDFAIRMRIRRIGDTSTGAANDSQVFDLRTGVTTGNPLIYIEGSDDGYALKYFASGADRITGPEIVNGVDYLVELSRIGGTSRLFVDGVQVGASYTDSGRYSVSQAVIGGRYGSISGNFRCFNGYIGEVQIKIGAGFNSASYTPLTGPYPTVDNTLAEGEYLIDTGSYTGEVTVICTDAFGSPVLNDLVLRTTPV